MIKWKAHQHEIKQTKMLMTELSTHKLYLFKISLIVSIMPKISNLNINSSLFFMYPTKKSNQSYYKMYAEKIDKLNNYPNN